MGWSHPDISLEDLLSLIKGFVDILTLASGYQSSGRPAVWDAQNMRKAMQWGLFFEDMIACANALLQHKQGMRPRDAVDQLDSAACWIGVRYPIEVYDIYALCTAFESPNSFQQPGRSCKPKEVFIRLRCLDDYEDSLKELDAAMLEMTSNPYFPQGLANLSSAILSRAREFVLQHLCHALPLRNAHLSTLLTAAVEMDLNDLKGRDYNYLNVYLDKLKLKNTSLNLATEMRGFMNNSMISYPNDVPPSHAQAADGSVCNPCAAEDSGYPGSPLNVSSYKLNGCHGANYSKLTVQEILNRQTAVSCISSIEVGLDLLAETTLCGKCAGSDDNLLNKRLYSDTSLLDEIQVVEFVSWNQWRSNNLSYFLDKRTIRMVSGANLIFSAPKVQWLQVFERLRISDENHDNVLLEIIEISLLGCIASRWSKLIEHLMSVSYDLLTISKQFQKVWNMFHGGSQLLHPKGEVVRSKENGIIEHLTGLLGGQLHHLWKLSPILTATAVPSWSALFRLYLNEIEAQLKGSSSLIRCCSCIQDGKDHKECELAERIWCLYIIHVRGSLLMSSISNT